MTGVWAKIEGSLGKDKGVWGGLCRALHVVWPGRLLQGVLQYCFSETVMF